jgi:pantoate--beta-alanine ligase
MVTLVQTTQALAVSRQYHSQPVAFVPTMGNLHAGHLSLLEKALASYQTVYFSIFVNPKQFGPNEDFNRYPRSLENDIKLIEKLAQRFSNSQIMVYSPLNPAEVFPASENQNISVQGLSTDLEGKIRPGHFDGVATVVHRLFTLIQPEAAYFGLKDYQQYLVIKQMVKDLLMPVKVIGMPIIREPSGLALSSRNQYLNPQEKEEALLLFKTLNILKIIINNKRSQIPEAQNYISTMLKDKNWNYLEIRDSETFSADVTNSNNITILAVYKKGTTRLLDNMQVEVQ